MGVYKLRQHFSGMSHGVVYNSFLACVCLHLGLQVVNKSQQHLEDLDDAYPVPVVLFTILCTCSAVWHQPPRGCLLPGRHVHTSPARLPGQEKTKMGDQTSHHRQAVLQAVASH